MNSTTEELSDMSERLPLQARLAGYLWLIACGSEFLCGLYFGSPRFLSLFGIYISYELLRGKTRARNLLLYLSWGMLILCIMIFVTLNVVLLNQLIFHEPHVYEKTEIAWDKIYFVTVPPALFLTTLLLLSAKNIERCFTALGIRQKRQPFYRYRMEHLVVLFTFVAITTGLINYRYDYFEKRIVFNNCITFEADCVCYYQTNVLSYSDDLKRVEFRINSMRDLNTIGIDTLQEELKVSCIGMSSVQFDKRLNRSTIQVGSKQVKYLVPLRCTEEMIEQYIKECPPSHSVDDYYQFVESLEKDHAEARQP